VLHAQPISILSPNNILWGAQSSKLHVYVIFPAALLPRPHWAQIFSSAPYCQTVCWYENTNLLLVLEDAKRVGQVTFHLNTILRLPLFVFVLTLSSYLSAKFRIFSARNVEWVSVYVINTTERLIFV
jgi:hypothetical protein